MELCRPLGPCDDRNQCYRYRSLPGEGDTVQDFSATHKIQDDEVALRKRCLCWKFYRVFDSDDDLMPPDWQESK